MSTTFYPTLPREVDCVTAYVENVGHDPPECPSLEADNQFGYGLNGRGSKSMRAAILRSVCVQGRLLDKPAKVERKLRATVSKVSTPLDKIARAVAKRETASEELRQAIHLAYSSGCSAVAIAEAAGVSRQRIHQILKGTR